MQETEERLYLTAASDVTCEHWQISGFCFMVLKIIKLIYTLQPAETI